MGAGADGTADGDVRVWGDRDGDRSVEDMARPNPPQPAHAAPAPGVSGPAGASGPRLGLTWWGLLLRAVVAFAMVLAANFLPWLVAEPLLQRIPESVLGEMLTICASFTGTGVLMVLGVWGWMRLVERRPLRAAGWHLSVAGLGWLVLGTAASCLVIGVAVTISGLLQPPSGQGINSGGLPLWATVLYVVTRSYVLQGLPEELLYRGWLFHLTLRRPLLTLTWTTAAFTIIHLISQGGQQTMVDRVLYLALPLGFGALGGALVLLTGSLWAAVGVHGGFHVAQTVATARLPAERGAAWWLLEGACYLAATAVVLVLWWRRGRRRPGCWRRAAAPP